MATRQQLEKALVNADAAGDESAARQLAQALRGGQYDQPSEAGAVPARGQPLQTEDVPQPGAEMPAPESDPAILRDLDEAFLKIPGAPALGEFAAAANRSIFDMVDFLGPDTVNAVFELAGSEHRMPTMRETFGSEGGYMEEGLARNVVQEAGELAPQAAAFGGLLRAMASRGLPAATQGESAIRGTARQLGSSTATQDVVGGAAAGAGGAAGEAAGGDTGRMIGTVAAPASMALPEMIRIGFRGGAAGLKNFQAAIDDFAEIGRSPTLGQGVGEGFKQGVESFSASLLGGSPIRRSIEATSSAMKKRVTQIADDLSSTKGELEAGRTIERGITGAGGFVDRFQAKSGQLWGRFDDLIDDTAPVSADNTTEALGRLVNDTEFGKVLNNPLLARIKTVMDDAGGQIDYSTFRQLRSAVGERLGSKDLVSDIPRAQLKQLYGALSQDLQGVASQYGDEAVAALGRANGYTRAGHDRLGTFVERIVNKADLDKVFSAATKGGEGVQSINAIKRSLKPEEWEVVASNVLRKLGRATSGQQDDVGEVFSVNKFLTDWDKLGRSKEALLSGSPKLDGYRNNLDKIARAAGRIKEGSQAMANPSGTGQFVANVGTLTAGGAALGTGNWPAFSTILAGIAINNGAARLMTSPKFVSWLGRSLDTENMASHIARLTAVAETPEQAESIAELLEDVKEVTSKNKPAPSAPQKR